MGFALIVDGPNFINDLNRYGKDFTYLMSTFSFPLLHMSIQRRLNIHGLRGHPFIHTYFVCADRGKLGKLDYNQRNMFLEKLKKEQGVTVDEIKQSKKSGQEEQVDMSVFIRMLEMGPLSALHDDTWRHIVLISSDSDYVPAIRLLSKMGTHTVTVGFQKLPEKEYPVEMINESYLFLELSELLSEMEGRKPK